jgi:hypothetical protein
METYLEGLARDFCCALRDLRQNRRFSLIAFCALALGIGASTVVFGVVYSVFIDALPYKHFSRSVVIAVHDVSNAGTAEVRLYSSREEVRALREQNHVLEELIGYAYATYV